jgi:hypothetical protein
MWCWLQTFESSTGPGSANSFFMSDRLYHNFLDNTSAGWYDTRGRKKMEYDTNDIHSMALCVWKEARGQGIAGMRAVAHVIKNRVGAAGFAATLHDVIYGKNQFTSMSVPSDPEFNLIPPSGDPQFAFCSSLCPSVLSDSDADLTYGAHYYENPKTATSGWFTRVIAGPDGNGTEGHSTTAQIGSQKFYL